MDKVVLQTQGLKWQQAIFKIASKLTEMQPGTLLEISGNHPGFERDIQKWCRRLKKTAVFTNNEEGDLIICRIQF